MSSELRIDARPAASVPVLATLLAEPAPPDCGCGSARVLDMIRQQLEVENAFSRQLYDIVSHDISASRSKLGGAREASHMGALLHAVEQHQRRADGM